MCNISVPEATVPMARNKKDDNAILPNQVESIIEPQERKGEKLKLNKTNKKSYTK